MTLSTIEPNVFDEANAYRKLVKQEYLEAIKVKDSGKANESGLTLATNSNCLLATLCHVNNTLHPKHRRSKKELIALSKTINLLHPIDEAVRLRPVEKKDGSFRPALSFGLIHKTAQLTVKELLTPYFRPQKSQFGHRGVPAAVKTVKKLMKAGNVFCCELDVTQFYQNVEVKTLLKDLPPTIPCGLAANAVTGSYLKIRKPKGSKIISPGDGGSQVGHTQGVHEWIGTSSGLSIPLLQYHYLIQDARKGLPTGAISSPMTGDWILSKLDMGGRVVTNFVDNFAVFATSPEELDARSEALIVTVESSPYGKFALKMKAKGSPTEPFIYLGHEFLQHQDEIEVRPTKKAVEALGDVFDQLFFRLYDLKPGQESKTEATYLLGKMHSLLLGWQGAFAACSNVGQFTIEYWEDIAKAAACYGVMLKTVAKASLSIEAWIPLDYDLTSPSADCYS